jgi:hypothetical protein
MAVRSRRTTPDAGEVRQGQLGACGMMPTLVQGRDGPLWPPNGIVAARKVRFQG